MAGASLLVEFDRARALKRAAWLAAKVPTRWDFKFAPEMVGHVMMSIYRASLLYSGDGVLFGESTAQQLRMVERSAILGMLGLALIYECGKRYFSAGWVCACAEMVPARSEIVVRRILSCCRMYRIAQGRVHRGGQQSFAYKVIFGKAALPDKQGNFSGYLDSQFRGLQAEKTGKTVAQQWCDMARDCGAKGPRLLLEPEQRAQPARRAIVYEGAKRVGQKATFRGEVSPPGDVERYAREVSKATAADLATLAFVRAEHTRESGPTMLCKNCGYMAKGIEVRFEQHQRGRTELINGRLGWECMRTQWEKSEKLVIREGVCGCDYGAKDVGRSFTWGGRFLAGGRDSS